MLPLERSRGTHDVAAEAEFWNPFGREQMCLDGIGKVETIKGIDVTSQFLLCANQALALCQQHVITVAVLTDFSPSCGSSQIYDGNFNRNLVQGVGVTTALLKRHGISVFNQNQISEAAVHLNRIDTEISDY